MVILPILTLAALAQPPAVTVEATRTLPSVAEKWNLFTGETMAPFTLEAAAFNSAVSQVTNSYPLYGRGWWPAYPERFGAAVADITTQNFFGDFLLASAFHQDTRYVRRGSPHRTWARACYAVSRAVITRTDSGAPAFNWSNVLGSALSTGLSNAYYPPASRTLHTTLVNWATDVAGSGLANLAPEFWPDFSRWIRRHLPASH